MGTRMFGLETEYALSVIGPSREPGAQERAIHLLMAIAQRELPHLPARDSSGMFLENGSRLYVDQGHPEVSTPEVVTPWDVCRYVLAGHQILANLAVRMAAEQPSLGQIFITRCNVSYGPGASTWGCHESYGHRADHAKLAGQIIPHLVSRVIYCGAGGFNNRHPGLEFMLSPRVAHLEQVFSGSSTANRGIYHKKDEPLSSGPYSRLHIICGESLCSQTALWLKTAITALVVASIEAGLNPCPRLRLRDPLGAMRSFTRDTRCTARAECTDGKMRTAIDMQREILAQLERHLDHPVMPSWAPDACLRLRAVLDRLEAGPGAVAQTLDWAIKLPLYQELARRHGVVWESLPHWNHILEQMDLTIRMRALESRGPEPSTGRTPTNNAPSQPAGQVGRISGLLRILRPPSGQLHWPETVLNLTEQHTALPEHTARLAALARQCGVGGDELDRVVKLRSVLLEVDTRFAELSEDGIFQSLDRSGVLEHAMPGVSDIDQAVTSPPAVGRARLRGEHIQEFHRRNGHYVCDWTGVWDTENRRFLDLSDPFTLSADWKEISEEEPAPPEGGCTVCFEVEELCDAGRYEDAQALLAPRLRSNLPNESLCRDRLRRLQAMVRRGQRRRPASEPATPR